MYPTGASIALYRMLETCNSEVTLGEDILGGLGFCSTTPARKSRREIDAGVGG